MRCRLDGTKINDVKYQALAVAAFLGQEARELVHASQLRLAETARNLSRGNRGDFELGLPGDARLHLLRIVKQHCVHNRQAGRGETNHFPFGDEADKLELAQRNSGQYLAVSNKPSAIKLRQQQVLPGLARQLQRGGSWPHLHAAPTSSLAKERFPLSSS